MKIKSILPFFFCALWIVSCKEESKETPKLYQSLNAPVAKKIPEELAIHGDTRLDNYFWMRLSDEQKNADSSDVQTQDVYHITIMVTPITHVTKKVTIIHYTAVKN